MSRYRKTFKNIFASLLLIASFSFNNHVLAADGEALFKANCANCHKPDKDYTGPALQGWNSRVPDADWIYKWMANPAQMIASDAYAKELFEKWKPTVMPAFANLKKEEIDAIMLYVDEYKPATAAPAGGAGVPVETDNSLLFGILTIVLAVVAFILLQVNSNLRKLTDEKEGIYRGEPVPFYRNKTYLMAGILLLFALGGYYTIEGAVGLGRTKNYKPEQPIFYSHEVHAGVNQISCLYCHGSAQDSKQAGIPAVNVCMNCHMAVKEYAGDPLFKEDGTQVDGTAEIQKLYEYAGWNPTTKAYNPDNNGDGVPDGAKPIPWVRIHNLPDHVYFNHSQHVKVGKQQCQTCHGNIQEMPEVYQFTDLSMGWCINCHRETKVDFLNKTTGEGNKFYSIYEKFHNDLKNNKMDSVTVEHIGGTECQKCHY
ncbi:MAG: c-type cytochrome [Sphingobacteriales bacterium]|nr:MAG: c-type cytochrome [Sphingobacteriales bacterium]